MVTWGSPPSSGATANDFRLLIKSLVLDDISCERSKKHELLFSEFVNQVI